MGSDSTAIKKNERNSMNMATTVGKHLFVKGDR